MRLAIFSDIHANLPALEAVLREIKALDSIDRVYCLGDLVGYAPYPNEVAEHIRTLCIPTIMGNYDDGTGFDRDECGCAYKDPVDKQLGEESFAWTKSRTTEVNKAFLRELVPEIRIEVDGKRILLVHGSPRRLNEYLFEDRPPSSFRRLAQVADSDVIVFGHTHIPYVKLVDGTLFVNAGSVGKPKDGDPRACYILLDVAEGTVNVKYRRLAYDVTTVAEAIRRSELPDEFAARLERGGA